ncbi:type 1 glutamine amidotransferase [Aspergillus ruber CBS 135680]|uniref:Class I glutamine amidotransferase-like protein n=1 Tax=Aspergillus ruber (strain CBS 135680) TaxID=1388766 RepID=A0A017RZW4_ASPRC|nr:class I glutamine amidotransferase-like protein [Aspergillus ruber CBS 135680]EYE90096.1 class I glutamine amidotransferase-like protein [Aspergillus ruber CBS 135680]
MAPPLRIAVLECDTPLDNINAKYEGYGGVFKELFRESAKRLGQPEKLDPETGFEISRWDIVDGDKYPNLDEVDALVLTGSKHNSFEDQPWILKLVEYTRQAIEHPRVRILGICFGHQIIGRALEAKVGRSDAGWEIAVCDMDLTEEGKKLFGKDKLRIQQMHQDIVYEYPANVTPLGSSPRCVVQGMYLPGKFITVQGHPEFTGYIVTEIVSTRSKLGVFSKDVSEDALNRAVVEHDGLAIGTVFLNFLLEDRK